MRGVHALVGDEKARPEMVAAEEKLCEEVVDDSLGFEMYNEKIFIGNGLLVKGISNAGTRSSRIISTLHGCLLA